MFHRSAAVCPARPATHGGKPAQVRRTRGSPHIFCSSGTRTNGGLILSVWHRLNGCGLLLVLYGSAEVDSTSLTRSGLILEPRILLVSHDLHHRLFRRWSYKLLSASDGRTIVSGDQSSEELVRETLRQVLQLGRHIFNATEQMMVDVRNTFVNEPNASAQQNSLMFIIFCL